VVADNVCDETYDFLTKYIEPTKILRTALNNAGAFMYSVKYAIEHFDENEAIYLAEDDYIYREEAPMVIEEGLSIGDYSSGYDHPDKYVNHNQGGPNPFISEGGEVTRVLMTKHKHWKLTNSCCMTFATKVKTLKEDYTTYQKYCSTTHPYDFQMFCELIRDKRRKIVSCIPGVSTHGETTWLSKLIDWEYEVKKTNSDLL
jgi:hypothetical protein